MSSLETNTNNKLTLASRNFESVESVKANGLHLQRCPSTLASKPPFKGSLRA